MPIDFNSFSTSALAVTFVTAAFVVWSAGTRLSLYVDAVADKTHLGKAFTGMLLLGGITSLPEVAAVSTSASIGDAPLAVNNLLGTASINLILLAAADFFYGRAALTGVAATPATLMQGVLSMLLSGTVALIATAGDIPVLGVGVGSTALLLGAFAALWLTSDFENRHVWEAAGENQERDERERRKEGNPEHPAQARQERLWSLRKLIAATVVAGLLILIGGFFLSSSADAFASKTGLASGMVGFVLVGLSTSLPEISSITSAILIRQYDMAVGDIFGTNLFNFGLIFLADFVYRGEPVLSTSGTFEVIGAILATLLTGIFLVGLLERRQQSIFRMGYDSLIAILLFAGGLFVLSQTTSVYGP